MNAWTLSTQPRIWFLIGHVGAVNPPSRLAQEVEKIRLQYTAVADIQVVDREFTDLLRFAKSVEHSGAADVFICAGATGAYLSRKLLTPVVLLQPTGYDIFYSLKEAHCSLPRTAIATFGRTIPELEYVRQLWDVKIRDGAYRTLREAQQLVRRFAAEKHETVIGSSMVTEIAADEGLHGVLITSPVAVRRALDDALALAQRTQAEAAERNRLNAILSHIAQAVIAADGAGTIRATNPAFSKLVDDTPANILDRNLKDVAPELAALNDEMRKGGAPRNHPAYLGNRSILVDMFSLAPEDRSGNPGSVIVVQEASAVHRADRHLRQNTNRKEFRARYRLEDVITASEIMRRLTQHATRYAKSDSTVLIRGASGTGKELIAQGIHLASPRASGPFVPINCASVPESLLESELFGYEEGAFSGARKGGKPGLLELAHRGTLFLDEIGDMPLPLQTRLLRVLQEREVVRVGGTRPTPINVRFVAATHRALEHEVKKERFREDLYYRVAILQLRVPALRDRPCDIAAIGQHLLHEISARIGVAPCPPGMFTQLLDRLQDHEWPGNIRELENVVERAILHFSATPNGDQSGQEAIDELVEAVLDQRPPPTSRETPPGMGNMDEITPEALHRTLKECGGKKARAAKRLGISRTTLWRRLRAEGGGR